MKISNAEKLINLSSVPSKESPLKNDGTHVTKEAANLPPLIPDKSEEQVEAGLREKRIKKWIACTALMFIIFYLIKSGLAKKVVVDFILKSRLVRWVLLLLFNYRISTGSSPVKKVL